MRIRDTSAATRRIRNRSQDLPQYNSSTVREAKVRSFRIFYKPNHHFPAISRFLTDRKDRIAVEHALSDDHLVIDFVFLHGRLKGRGTGIQCLITAVDEGGFRTVRKIALLQTQPLKTIFTIFIRTSVSQKRIISLWNSPTFL